jgi:hypothetical protein
MQYALLIYETSADFSRRGQAGDDATFFGAWRAYYKAVVEAGIYAGVKPLEAPETGTTQQFRNPAPPDHGKGSAGPVRGSLEVGQRGEVHVHGRCSAGGAGGTGPEGSGGRQPGARPGARGPGGPRGSAGVQRGGGAETQPQPAH